MCRSVQEFNRRGIQDLGRLAIVVVQEAAERVPAPDGASRGARVRCQRDVLVEALVRARLIEERRIAREHVAQMRLMHDEQVVEALGARKGVRTIVMPSLAKTASNVGANFASRSWMRKLGGCARSWSDQHTWRACCVTQAVVGWAVQPATCTRRVPISRKKRT